MPSPSIILSRAPIVKPSLAAFLSLIPPTFSFSRSLSLLRPCFPLPCVHACVFLRVPTSVWHMSIYMAACLFLLAAPRHDSTTNPPQSQPYTQLHQDGGLVEDEAAGATVCGNSRSLSGLSIAVEDKEAMRNGGGSSYGNTIADKGYDCEAHDGARREDEAGFGLLH